MCKKLLDRNFWIDAPDGSRLTALTYAVSNGHTELCLRLLIRGASVHVYDESGRGPLHSVRVLLK